MRGGGGGGLWLWENGGQVGSMVYGGGGFHASCFVCLSSLFSLRSGCVDFAADLAKQWRKNSCGGFQVSKNNFCVYLFFWCVFLFVINYSFHAVQGHARCARYLPYRHT